MSDLIDRQAAINAVYKCADIFAGDMPVMVVKADAYEALAQLPSAQHETAKFIRWMECKKTDNYISYTPHCKCSKCGTEFLITTIKYCYMCGARMEENDEAD